MEDHGFRSLADFTLINVNGCVTSFAAHYAGGLGSAISSVRLLLRFLFERNLTITDLSQSLPELMATRKMFHEGFTEDELEYLLEHPDRTTAIGKRDYAMMGFAGIPASFMCLETTPLAERASSGRITPVWHRKIFGSAESVGVWLSGILSPPAGL